MTDQPRQRTVAELLAAHGDAGAGPRRRRRREEDDSPAALPVVAGPLRSTALPDRSRDTGPQRVPPRPMPSGSHRGPLTAPAPTPGPRAPGPTADTRRPAGAPEPAGRRANGVEPASAAPPRPANGRPGPVGFRPIAGRPAPFHGASPVVPVTPARGPGPLPAGPEPLRAVPSPPAGSAPVRPDPPTAGPRPAPSPGPGPRTATRESPPSDLTPLPGRGPGGRPDRAAPDGGPATGVWDPFADDDDDDGGANVRTGPAPRTAPRRNGSPAPPVEAGDRNGPTDRAAIPDPQPDADPSDLDDPPVDEGRPAQAWAGVVAQWLAGAVAGAVLWVLFGYLWRSLPVVALAAALLVTAGLVLGVRQVLHQADRRTTAFAVVVGLLLTASPAVLVLLGR